MNIMMNEPKKLSYDVVIIGGGISGLVSACFLSKAGLSVLLVEQHRAVGGYCSSFSRNGYKFDTGVHYLGGVKNGSLASILREIDIKNELKFIQSDPSDKIVIPKNKVYIRANAQNTIVEFKNSFPKEKTNIDNFFKFAMQPSVASIYRKVMRLNFKEVLDSFFKDRNLKESFGVLFFGNMGLPLSKISGISGIIFLNDFLLDPGYYPIGGIQAFPDFLCSKIKEFGGEVILCKKVEKIITDKLIVKGIILSPDLKISTKFVISTIDSTQTFGTLIEDKTRESDIIKKLVPSTSCFVVYLGLKNELNSSVETCNTWYFPIQDIESSFKSLEKDIVERKICGGLISFPSNRNNKIDKTTIRIICLAPFKNKEFWQQQRDPINEEMIALAERIIPNLRDNIKLQFNATPLTFYNYTLNKNGAAFGWASTRDQTSSLILPQKTSIKNLFIAGHWITRGAGQGGVSTVAVSGKNAAKLVLAFLKKS